MENIEVLVRQLCAQKDELPWLEFKHNNYNPETIGEDISALANGAALDEKNYAYFIWGVEDKTHAIVGTEYTLQNIKKGNEELENWLRQMLSDNADFEYEVVEIEGHFVGVMKILRAMNRPVAFQKTPYVRIGSYTRKLQDIPAVQARLWARLQNTNYEEQIARENLQAKEVLQLIDYNRYFDLVEIPLPDSIEGMIHYLREDSIVVKQDNGLYSITNMGAILFAKKLSNFSSVSRKAVRVVQYEGNNRLKMLRENVDEKGYAVGYEELIRFIDALLPSEEVITDSIREKKLSYPTLAIREIIANALIHQDLSVSGAGPVVEIFSNRLEITNPGAPLVDINRIIDNPPKSRNEKLASMMRRMGMCEELGTGWDKIVITCEVYQIPAPKIEIYEESTRVILYSDIPYAKLTPEDKIRSCYMHACIQQVQGEYLTNSSLRKRFGVPDSSSGSISRLIKEATEMKLIKPVDPNTSNKYMKYVPIWA